MAQRGGARTSQLVELMAIRSRIDLALEDVSVFIILVYRSRDDQRIMLGVILDPQRKGFI